MALFEDIVLRFCTDILTYVVDQCADDVLEQVRISAARALGVLAQYASFGKACVRALVRKLGDSEPKVVRAAAGCLIELEREDARVEAVSQCLLFMQQNFSALLDVEHQEMQAKRLKHHKKGAEEAGQASTARQLAMRCLNNSLIFVGGQIKQFKSRQLNAEFCDLLL